MGFGWGGQEAIFLLVSVSLNPLLSGNLNLFMKLVSFGEFCKICKFMSLEFHDHCLGTECESVKRW